MGTVDGRTWLEHLSPDHCWTSRTLGPPDADPDSSTTLNWIQSG